MKNIYSTKYASNVEVQSKKEESKKIETSKIDYIRTNSQVWLHGILLE